MGCDFTLFFRQKIASLIYPVFIYLVPLFDFISTYIFSSLKKNDEKTNFLETEEPGLSQEIKAEKDVNEFRDFDFEEEKPKPEISFKFKFPTFEEIGKIQNGTTGNDVFNSEVVPCASTSKSFVSTFIDEFDTYPAKEINATNKTCNFSEKEESSSGRKFKEIYSGKRKEILVYNGDENEKIEAIEYTGEAKAPRVREDEEFFEESKFVSEKNSLVDSYSDGFLSDGDFGEKMESDSELSAFDENNELSENSDDEESYIIEELEKLEEDNNDFLSEKDFNEDLDTNNTNDAEFVNNSEKTKSKDLDCGDGNKLESLWEHQELIDQLKMELKKVRATGLPTIFEESESPKIMDDLKPWKIDEKFQREDCIGELHKFYKSYREKMRKFDILNYQKMYAMGFLQLKDPLQSTSKQKSSAPTLKSLVSQNLWLFKHKIHGSDPMKKFIKELEGDLEVVYVGQMCLSWEFLHWQYEKALDLWDSDPRGIRRYNEVAGEFQQFQVLMQRFIEDEPFQGPRVQNYVKSRCVLRNLLQVPVIREDNMKDKRKARLKDGDEYVITSDMVVEIVEESIRILWRFVQADKDCATSSINGHKKMPELNNPEDLKLLLEVKKNLQKKEKKVKDLLRSENCILRKLRRSREDDSDQVLYFFSQVDMKLVSRVLNMSKITRDQLMWCHSKLNRINIVNRKICVEPAFLLFPC